MNPKPVYYPWPSPVMKPHAIYPRYSIYGAGSLENGVARYLAHSDEKHAILQTLVFFDFGFSHLPYQFQDIRPAIE
jgi:hypothetical protein